MSTDKAFVTHSAEQVLRFTRVENWDDLSEARKVQLGFNLGALAMALGLPKEDSFDALTRARTGTLSMNAFRDHLRSLIESNRVAVDQDKVAKPF